MPPEFMSKSQKPRKKYDAKNRPARFSALFISKKLISEVREIFLRPQLIAELQLHRGTVTYENAAVLRDFFNTASVWLVFLRDVTHELNPEWDDAYSETHARAVASFSQWYHRGIDAGAVHDDSVRFVCTGEELKNIRDGIEILSDVVMYAIDNKPRHFVKLYMMMKQFLGDRVGRVTMSEKNLADLIKSMLRDELRFREKKPI